MQPNRTIRDEPLGVSIRRRWRGKHAREQWHPAATDGIVGRASSDIQTLIWFKTNGTEHGEKESRFDLHIAQNKRASACTFPCLRSLQLQWRFKQTPEWDSIILLASLFDARTKSWQRVADRSNVIVQLHRYFRGRSAFVNEGKNKWKPNWLDYHLQIFFLIFMHFHLETGRNKVL